VKISLYRYSITTLCVNILVILWGAYVRATGSGAGCGNHWPLCNGEIVPQSPAVETLIEFTHRITSGIAFLLVLGLVMLTRRELEKYHPARRFALLAFVFMIFEALIGAGLVLFELVAFNTSIARAVVGALHLLNTFLLLGSIVAVIETMGDEGAGKFIFSGVRGWLLVIAMLCVLLVGMSGAIAALGDTLFPSDSLLAGISQEFSDDAHFLVRLRVWHPVIAIITSLLILVGLRLPAPDDQRSLMLDSSLVILVLIQLFAGVVNVLLLAPVWLQIIHLLLADLIWVGLIALIFRTQRITTDSWG
jgi:heme A synthase